LKVKKTANIRERSKFYLEEKVRYIVEQLTSALKHVHDKGVCHRDITASNIIINESSAKNFFF